MIDKIMLDSIMWADSPFTTVYRTIIIISLAGADCFGYLCHLFGDFQWKCAYLN